MSLRLLFAVDGNVGLRAVVWCERMRDEVGRSETREDLPSSGLGVGMAKIGRIPKKTEK